MTGAKGGSELQFTRWVCIASAKAVPAVVVHMLVWLGVVELSGTKLKIK